MTQQAITASEPTGLRANMRAMTAFLKERLTPRLGATVAVWQFEAKTATPLAILLVATLGRWEGALAMGTIMAVYSAVLLFLLEGERVMDDARDWMRDRTWGRGYLRIAERDDVTGRVQRAVAVPGTIFLMGPFWRAVTYHLARVPRIPAYLLSVGGAIPHSLLWTGLVLGGAWTLVGPYIEDALASAWDVTIAPLLAVF